MVNGMKRPVVKPVPERLLKWSISMAVRRACLGLLLALISVGCGSSAPRESGNGVAVAAITFAQSNYATPQSAMTTVTITYNNAQTAGNLNVVAVGWNDATSTVSSVVDSKGNTYVRAVGPTVKAGFATQSIYYAKSIVAAAAGTNVVTVAFNQAAAFPDIRIGEYSGVDPVNPVDVTVASTGSSITTNSGSLTTTNANDLLVAANLVESLTISAGTGFTNRGITVPDGDILEDRTVTSVGTYSATANLNQAAQWVMQLVAFRALVTGGGTDAGVDSTDTAPPLEAAADVKESGADAGIDASQASVDASVDAAAEAAVDAGVDQSTGSSDASPDASGGMSIFPIAPSSLTATADSATQITLSWAAATCTIGTVSYSVESCAGGGCTNFAPIATTSATAYINTGLNQWTTYRYRVRATDGSGNFSAYSAIASALTPFADSQAPTAPTNVAATAPSSTQISVTWTASTDNNAVTGYLVERCVGPQCSSFTQLATIPGTTYTDSAVAASTSYSYRVRATDAANNLSAYSNVASATTPAGTQTAAPPAFIQANFSCPQAGVNSVPVTFDQPQSAGDLNVIIIGWNDDTSLVSSVTDTLGNVYSLAVGPTILSGSSGHMSQSIYYAPNVAAAGPAGNTVTVNFNTAAAFPDIRILEYSGIQPVSPLDVGAGAQGTSNVCSTPGIATTNSYDLLVAGNMITTQSNGAGVNFTKRLLTTPDGDVAEDRTVTSTGVYSATIDVGFGGWIAQVAAFKALATTQPPPADVTAPTTSITSPAGGATVSGIVNVAVSATDSESGVASVQLLVDEVEIVAPDTASPYSLAIDTRMFANGPHTLRALGWDNARNVGSSGSLTVTFSNASPGNPAASGIWEGTRSLPIVPVQVALLPSSKILMYDGQQHGADARVWDPALDSTTSSPAPTNIFCTGLNQMADGKIFIGGGHSGAHVGLTANNAFDPGTQTWSVLPDMVHPRWYTSVAMLPNGRLLEMSGEDACSGCFVTVPEIYDPVGNTWTQLTSSPFSFPYFPHLHILTDGRLLVSSTSEAPIQSQVLDFTTGQWSAVGGGSALDGGSAVMYAPNKILKFATSVDPDTPVRNSVKTAYVLDMNQSNPDWRQVTSMAFARTYQTGTVLPDGTVLVTGGGPTTAGTDVDNAILPAELWSPSGETFSTLASMHAARLYHSNALLMPDARVLVAGGGRFDESNAPTDQFSAEFFAPPYLFKGPRPMITSAPTTLQYGQAFTVQTPDAARIASVSLVRFGATTHTNSMGQRFVPLSFTTGTGSLSVTAPVNANSAPPGNYMLFLVDTNGVPSVAAIVHF
jgi:hypothetical protein